MSTSSTPNSDLTALHDLLVEQVNQLSYKLGQESDPDMAQKILTEMQEITHRIDMVQSLLFTQQSDRIAANEQDVQNASAEFAKSLAQINDAAAFIDACTKFLTYVDTAIDFAKKVAVAV